jgi:hypothetical protein
MSMTILRRREQESFEVPPLPVRRTGLDLRESLARFCAPVTSQLGPGERIIGGRVFYSAAWLGAAPFEPEAVKVEPVPAGRKG